MYDITIAWKPKAYFKSLAKEFPYLHFAIFDLKAGF